jgi:photosynthetic reaction center cytochrome c subunit
VRSIASARLARAFAGALAVAVAAATPAVAQPRPPRPLENIRTLKGWSGDEVRAEMRLMTDALGVKCEHCHVQGNFPSDEKRTKQAARRMIDLTVALNAEYFPGQPPPAAGASKFGRVTCYTCHQGAATPKTSAGAGDRR